LLPCNSLISLYSDLWILLKLVLIDVLLYLQKDTKKVSEDPDCSYFSELPTDPIQFIRSSAVLISKIIKLLLSMIKIG